MRKSVVLLTLLILPQLFNCVIGQDTLKPVASSWATELNIDPFNGKFSLNNANGQIKVRKFMKNNTALRLAFTMGYQQDNSKMEYPYGVNPVYEKDIKKSTLLAVNIGQEKHFSGSRRISPYIGFDFGFGLKLTREELSSDDGSVEIKGAWREYYYSGSYYTSRYAERGFWSLGVHAVSGMDFYVTKNFYLGCELAFGLDYLNYSKIEVTEDDGNNEYPDTDDESWKMGPKLLNGIRIGYVF